MTEKKTHTHTFQLNKQTNKTCRYKLSPPGILNEKGGLLTIIQSSAGYGAVGTVTISPSITVEVSLKEGKYINIPVPTTAQTTVKASSAQATILSISDVRLLTGNDAAATPQTTLYGEQGTQTGHIAFAATLDDGQRYNLVEFEEAINSLPGLFAFSSTDNAVLQVDTGTGEVILAANGAEPVGITVATVAVECNADTAPGSVQIKVHANLQPTISGDVDFGTKLGTPVGPCTLGDSISVPVSINTDNRLLAGFELLLEYDVQHLKYTGTTTTIRSNDGKADVLASSKNKGSVFINGLIQNTKVRGTSIQPYTLFAVGFDCVGVTRGSTGPSALKGQSIIQFTSYK